MQADLLDEDHGLDRMNGVIEEERTDKKAFLSKSAVPTVASRSSISIAFS
jgi:hypothetical protein